MTVVPPGGVFQDPEAFEPEEVREVEELYEKSIPVHREEHHEHGDDCGHEAVKHGDHTDYLHNGRRHFFHLRRWHEHEE